MVIIVVTGAFAGRRRRRRRMRGMRILRTRTAWKSSSDRPAPSSLTPAPASLDHPLQVFPWEISLC
jgi:hypothetical protein